MEGKEKAPQENEEKGLKVHVVRHGPAAYGELEGKLAGYGPEFNRDQAEAKDLSVHGRGKTEGKNIEELESGTKEAITKVQKTAEEIAESLEPDEEVVIWSSGTGRTLETARIIRDELRKRRDALLKEGKPAFTIRERGRNKEEHIQVFDRFEDIREFDYYHFVALADGGELFIDGKKVKLDKKETNPDGLDYTEYYCSGAIHNIPDEVKEKWPKKLRDSVDKMESYEEISKRVLRGIERVSRVEDKKYRLIIASHGSAIDPFVRTYKPDALKGVSPAEFVTLERKGDKMVVTKAGAIPEGDSETDVFEKFEHDKASDKIPHLERTPPGPRRKSGSA